MRVIMIGVTATWCFLAQTVAIPGSQIIVTDADGAAARVAAPMSAPVDLATLPGGKEKSKQLQLVEVTKGTGQPIPAQFEADTKGSSRGTLWWLMPAGPKGERRFCLQVAKQAWPTGPNAKYDTRHECVDISEGDQPVLRYNHGTVPPPPEIVEAFEKKHDPPWYYARGDYIHPIYGPDGEQITDDYSLNHPHHRGCFWSWPVLSYRGEIRDIWAVRIAKPQKGGVWSRPVAVRRVVSGPVMALIDVENAWRWDDKESIVKEDVTIRVFHVKDKARFIDVKITLTALVDSIAIGGRPGPGYGGFTFRTFPEFDQRKIDLRIDPKGTQPQVAWFHLTGNFPGGKGPAGVALLQHLDNPDYPHYPDAAEVDGKVEKYPEWRTITTGFPGNRTVQLPKGQPLTMQYRLWIHPGLSSDEVVNDLWHAYNK